MATNHNKLLVNGDPNVPQDGITLFKVTIKDAKWEVQKNEEGVPLRDESGKVIRVFKVFDRERSEESTRRFLRSPKPWRIIKKMEQDQKKLNERFMLDVSVLLCCFSSVSSTTESFSSNLIRCVCSSYYSTTALNWQLHHRTLLQRTMPSIVYASNKIVTKMIRMPTSELSSMLLCFFLLCCLALSSCERSVRETISPSFHFVLTKSFLLLWIPKR